MEVANMEIVFTAVTGGMEAGFGLVKKGMGGIVGLASTVTSDMARLGSSVLNTSLKMGMLGVAGLGAMTALAAKSPALAPSIALFNVEMFKLSNTVGEILAPHMGTLIGYFSDLVSWVGENQTGISSLVGSFISMGTALADVVIPPLQMFADWIFENQDNIDGVATSIQGVADALNNAGIMMEGVGAFTTGLESIGGGIGSVVGPAIGGDLLGAVAGVPNLVTGGLWDKFFAAMGAANSQQTRKDQLQGTVDFIGGFLG